VQVSPSNGRPSAGTIPDHGGKQPRVATRARRVEERVPHPRRLTIFGPRRRRSPGFDQSSALVEDGVSTLESVTSKIANRFLNPPEHPELRRRTGKRGRRRSSDREFKQDERFPDRAGQPEREDRFDLRLLPRRRSRPNSCLTTGGPSSAGNSRIIKGTTGNARLLRPGRRP